MFVGLAEHTAGSDLDSPDTARWLDDNDKLRHLRAQFNLPGENGHPLIYFCGNSLGPQPKLVDTLISEELQVWSQRAVEGHFEHPHGRPWMTAADQCADLIAPLVGADPAEVAVMGGLTGNLHQLLCSFYRPTPDRHKIIIEAHAFSSDYFVVESQARLHGYTDAILEVKPREGEDCLSTEDIVDFIERHGQQCSIVLFSTVQYLTGQLFDTKAIVRAAHGMGCYVGMDLAHAIGNVPQSLHADGVDFAVWCSYKYLNAGPGAISGLFLHSQHHGRLSFLRGWWGTEVSSRLKMEHTFRPSPGARGLELSNGNILAVTSLLAALQTVYVKGGATIAAIRQKSVWLSQYLRHLLRTIPSNKLEIITPTDPMQSGAQLSLRIKGIPVHDFFQSLRQAGVVGDQREPDIIRLAPAAPFNTFQEVFQVAQIIIKILQ